MVIAHTPVPTAVIAMTGPQSRESLSTHFQISMCSSIAESKFGNFPMASVKA